MTYVAPSLPLDVTWVGTATYTAPPYTAVDVSWSDAVAVIASGALPALALVAPAATGAVLVSASGELPALSVAPPTADASTIVATTASGSLPPLALQATAATATPGVSRSGALPTLSLVAPTGTASTVAATYASGALAPLSLAGPEGAHATAVSGAGTILPVVLQAPAAAAAPRVQAAAPLTALSLTAPDGIGIDHDPVGVGTLAPIWITPPTAGASVAVFREYVPAVASRPAVTVTACRALIHPALTRGALLAERARAWAESVVARA